MVARSCILGVGIFMKKLIAILPLIGCLFIACTNTANNTTQVAKMSQKNLATQDMTQWLSYPTELGKEPAEIECTNEFDYLDMTYYIFKFKDNSSDTKWMLGVCGGYEENATQNCGHTFSFLNEYNSNTEKEDAIEIIERIRQCWIEESKKFE